MSLGDINDWLADLPTFLKLAQLGSMTKAAKDIGVPRSTVSRRIARIEQAMGLALFERTTRSLRLTESGRILAHGAGPLLAQLQTLKETAIAKNRSFEGVLRAAAPPGLSGPFLGHYLRSLRESLPGVSIDFRVSERFPHLIDEGFDLVLWPGPLNDAPWVRKKLGQSRTIAVASKLYFQTHNTPTSVTDLNQHQLLSVRGLGMSGDTWPLMSGGQVPVTPFLKSNDMSSIVDAVKKGLGIALLPMHLIFAEALKGELIPVLIREVGRSMDIYALFAEERRKSPMLRAVLEHMDEFGNKIQSQMPDPSHL